MAGELRAPVRRGAGRRWDGDGTSTVAHAVEPPARPFRDVAARRTIGIGTAGGDPAGRRRATPAAFPRPDFRLADSPRARHEPVRDRGARTARRAGARDPARALLPGARPRR